MENLVLGYAVWLDDEGGDREPLREGTEYCAPAKFWGAGDDWFSQPSWSICLIALEEGQCGEPQQVGLRFLVPDAPPVLSYCFRFELFEGRHKTADCVVIGSPVAAN